MQILNCLPDTLNTALASQIATWTADKTAEGYIVQTPCLSTAGQSARDYYTQFWARSGPRPDYVNFLGGVPRFAAYVDSDGHGPRLQLAGGYFLTPGLTNADFDTSGGRNDVVYFTVAAEPVAYWAELFFENTTLYSGSLTTLQLYQRYYNKLHTLALNNGALYTSRIAKDDYLGPFGGIGTGVDADLAPYAAFKDEWPQTDPVTPTPCLGGEDGFWQYLHSNPRVFGVYLSGGLPFCENGLYYIGGSNEFFIRQPQVLYCGIMGSFISDTAGTDALIPVMQAGTDTVISFYVGFAEAQLSRFLSGMTAGQTGSYFTPASSIGNNPISVVYGDSSHRMPAPLIAAFNPIAGSSLQGTINSVSFATATLRGTGALSGRSDSVSTASAMPSPYSPLAGVIHSASSLTGTLSGAGALLGQVDAQSTCAGNLVALGTIQGVSHGVSSATGRLQGTGALAGTISSVSDAIGFYSSPQASGIRFTGDSLLSPGGTGSYSLGPEPPGSLFASSEFMLISDGGVGGVFTSAPLEWVGVLSGAKAVTWTPPSTFRGAFTLTVTGSGAIVALRVLSGMVTGGMGPPPPPPTPGTGEPSLSMLASFTDAIVVTATGQIPVAYLARQESHQIGLLNTRFPSPVPYCRYVTHAFTGDEKQRNARKQARRILLWGQGSIEHAVLTIVADGERPYAYAYGPLSANAPAGLLWSQGLIPLIGRTFTIILEASGVGIEVNECQVEYILYG